MNSADNGLTPVEQHLGDRLAALIDGELGHDARERVLSHLATCWSCKTEAEAQRRLKSVFADTAPPPPSDGLLARLQGLPAGGAGGMPGGSGPGGLPRGDAPLTASADGFGGGRSPLLFAPLPGGSGPSVLAPAHGARSHRDHDLDRSASRGRRFAFAAAGAFSMAALALSGTVGGATLSGATQAPGERGTASTANQARPAATTAAAAGESRRRTATALSAERGARSLAATPMRAPIALVAASHSRAPLAGYSVFTPSLTRAALPPRVVPEAPPTGANAEPAPAPAPALPMAGPRP